MNYSLSQSRPLSLQPGTSIKVVWRHTDNFIVLAPGSIGDSCSGSISPWALQIRAVALEEPGQLVRILTGGILGCGGWVLSRGTNDAGRVNLLFEFERQVCLDIYTVLVASGIELTPSGHLRLTELCQCTRMGPEQRSGEIASVDLEIQTYPLDLLPGPEWQAAK